MEVPELVKKYLSQSQVMQLATASGDQPWVCNVHFVPGEKHTLYWMSKPNRRHSQEINKNSKAAAAIAVKSPEHPVIGLQIEGEGQEVTDPEEIKAAMKLFSDRYKVSQEFYESIINGTASDRLYKIVPKVIVLFDEENFPDNPRQELKM